MPAAVIPFVAWAIGAGATATAIGTVIGVVLMNVAVGALSKLLAGSQPKYSGPPVNVTVRGTIENRHIIWGRRRGAGVLVFYGVSGPNNKYLWYVSVLTGHQNEMVRDVWVPP